MKPEQPTISEQPVYPKQVTTPTPEKIPFTTRLKHFWQQLTRQGLWLTFLEGIDQIHRIITGAPTRRFSEITPQIHLGGQYRSYGWPVLVKRGITAVVNMRGEFSDRRSNIIPGQYLHLPTVDNTPPTLEQLYQGIEFMKQEIEQGGKVYVHCWEGIGRGPTMVAAYLVSTGMTAEDAWKHIRKIRPFIRPTDAQVAQIERLAADMRQKGTAKVVE
jgi:dual specificity MAP kinase phosphatase